MNINEAKKISIDLNGSETQKGSNMPVHIAKEGKNQSKIYDITKDCTVPKEMERTGLYKNNGESNFFSNKNQINSNVKSIVKSLTEDDLSVLEKQETPLEGYSSSDFDRTIERIKKERASKQESVDEQVKLAEEKCRQLERSVVMSAVKGTPAEKMVGHISDANLPVTPEIAIQIANAVDMTAKIHQMSAGGTNQLIENPSTITPKNIEQSSCIQDTKWQETKDGFEKIRNQALMIFKSEGKVATADDLESAKYLFENHLPVTMENITKYQTIEELKELEPEVFIERIVDCMVDGMEAQDADLSLISRNEAADLVKPFITVQRQLEEMRLKLTIDAARNLRGRGFVIDTTHLQEVVEGLKELEKESTRNLLEETQTPVTEQNVERVRETFLLIDQIRSAPCSVLGKTLEKGMNQTLPELAENANLVKQAYMDREVKKSTSLEQRYEAVGTEVRKDLGDSIKKAFSNVDVMLENLEMPVTSNNKRAVRILAYNQMEISRESIANIKEYDSKVNHFIGRMTPTAVTALIKENINPLELPMDEVAEIVDDLVKDKLPQDETFRQYLWKMDKQGGLSESERKSFVGIYRLLDKVEKSDGAVIGSLVKQGRNITLSSMLSAVRTRKREGMDIQIDDDFGGLKEVKTEGTSISDQITAAFGETLVTDLQKELSPKKIKTLGEKAMTMPLDVLLEECKNTVGEKRTYYKMRAEEIRILKETARDAESFLEKVDMPDSLENLAMAKAYLENGLQDKKWKWKKEDSKKVIDAFDDKELLETIYNEVEDSQLKSIAEDVGKATSFATIQNLREMSQSISFYRNLRQREMYEIPIVTEDGIATVNVTVQSSKNKKDTGTVQIRMESKSLGKLHATFRVRGKEVLGFITSEEDRDLSNGREIFSSVEEELSKNGYHVKDISFVKGSRNGTKVGQQMEKETSVKNLYQVAKIFINIAVGEETNTEL